MKNSALIVTGKFVSDTIRRLNLGHGSTWPGHTALRLNKHFIRDLVKNSGVKIILVAGTNGKTTTSLLLRKILEDEGKKVIHNESGANLLNGIASTLLLASTLQGKIHADYAIFEVDENSLPQVLESVTPDYIILLNLFRDQLDRYGEVEIIARKWENALKTLPEKTVLVANADDPRIAYLGMSRDTTIYYGLPESKGEKVSLGHAVDSIYCPRCNTKLTYSLVFYSHLGKWRCEHCHLRQPDLNVSKDIDISLSGTYNLSNALSLIALSHKLGTRDSVTANALKSFSPAFGRQEKIISSGKTIQLFLSKNPTGFNESLRTIKELGAKHVMFVLNDRIADGKDVSWIWDIDIESFLSSFTSITISGDRAYDMALRLKYAENKEQRAKSSNIEDNLDKALQVAIKQLPDKETLYILPTYTAMLEVRKVLKGRKIL